MKIAWSTICGVRAETQGPLFFITRLKVLEGDHNEVNTDPDPMQGSTTCLPSEI